MNEAGGKDDSQAKVNQLINQGKPFEAKELIEAKRKEKYQREVDRVMNK